MRAWFSIPLLCFAPLAIAAQLSDLHLWDGQDGTQVVFEFKGEVTHRLFTLANPDRVVVDIAGVDPGVTAKVDKTAGMGIVKDLRSAEKTNGTLRVVLDVAGPVDARSFNLTPEAGHGYRLVLYLNPASPAMKTPSEQPALAVPAPAASVAAVTTPVAPAVPAETAAPAAAAPVASAMVAAPASAPDTVATVRPVDKPIVIAVDAGHGGDDPGARGPSGLLEKNVSLSIARKLAQLIDQQPGMKAVLTRDGDYYVGLRQRVQVARKAQADLFISIHCNALERRAMHGTAVYALSQHGASNENARWLANQENAADMVGGIDIQDKDHQLAAVLIDLSQSATMEASLDVGSRILTSLGGVNVLQKPTVQQAGFVVLKAPDIPSVLVETAFITNPHEERLLGSDAYQDKLASAILRGVKGYFKNYRPHEQVVVDEPVSTPAAPVRRKARAVGVSYERQARADTAD